jgi:hypothetical protein
MEIEYEPQGKANIWKKDDADVDTLTHVCVSEASAWTERGMECHVTWLTYRVHVCVFSFFYFIFSPSLSVCFLLSPQDIKDSE